MDYYPNQMPLKWYLHAGVCCAGMHAFKYAYMSIKTGDAAEAVATGSERFSGSLISKYVKDEAEKLKELSENPISVLKRIF
jgi:3-oxoacyl-[acyl-carrier-protein] synthase-3